MTEENLKWLENVFRRTVGENGEIRLQDFKNIVHSKNVSCLFYYNSLTIWRDFLCPKVSCQKNLIKMFVYNFEIPYLNRLTRFFFFGAKKSHQMVV